MFCVFFIIIWIVAACCFFVKAASEKREYDEARRNETEDAKSASDNKVSISGHKELLDKCPRCGTLASGYFDICINCGTKLYK